MRRFSEFATEDVPFDGQKRRVDEVLNREIVIMGARVTESKFSSEGESRKKCAMIQFREDEKVCVLFTGSQVLVNQLEKYQEEIPFMATIKRIDRYYTFA